VTPSMRRVMEYESSIVGSYSDVHCERTRRKVMEDLPAPPSPQIVMEIGTGGVREVSGREVVDGDVGEVGDRILILILILFLFCKKREFLPTKGKEEVRTKPLFCFWFSAHVARCGFGRFVESEVRKPKGAPQFVRRVGKSSKRRGATQNSTQNKMSVIARILPVVNVSRRG